MDFRTKKLFRKIDPRLPCCKVESPTYFWATFQGPEVKIRGHNPPHDHDDHLEGETRDVQSLQLTFYHLIFSLNYACFIYFVWKNLFAAGSRTTCGWVW